MIVGLPLESVAGSLKCGRLRRTLRLYAKALKAVFFHFCFVTLFETHPYHGIDADLCC